MVQLPFTRYRDRDDGFSYPNDDGSGIDRTYVNHYPREPLYDPNNSGMHQMGFADDFYNGKNSAGDGWHYGSDNYYGAQPPASKQQRGSRDGLMDQGPSGGYDPYYNSSVDYNFKGKPTNAPTSNGAVGRPSRMWQDFGTPAQKTERNRRETYRASGEGEQLFPTQSQQRQSIEASRLESQPDEKELKKGRNTNVFRPWFTYAISFAQLIAFVVSLVINFQVTGEVIQTRPQFNPMIGAAPAALIYTGAFFIPCMKQMAPAVPGKPFTCPGGLIPRDAEANRKAFPNFRTASESQELCVFSDLCGFSGEADQWYRFLIPTFLHSGLVHLGVNLLFQLGTMRSLETDWGALRVMFIYFISGFMGFIFGGNLLSPKSPSVGASGCLFGMLAALILDLVQNWNYIASPLVYLIKIVGVAIFTFVLGLTPWTDNFAHIGGFVAGFLATVTVMPTNFTRFKRYIDSDRIRNIGIRSLSFALLATAGGVLLSLFYTNDEYCEWCTYLNCIPIFGVPCS